MRFIFHYMFGGASVVMTSIAGFASGGVPDSIWYKLVVMSALCALTSIACKGRVK